MMLMQFISSRNFQKVPNILQHEAADFISLSSAIKCLQITADFVNICEFATEILSEAQQPFQLYTRTSTNVKVLHLGMWGRLMAIPRACEFQLFTCHHG